MNGRQLDPQTRRFLAMVALADRGGRAVGDGDGSRDPQEASLVGIAERRASFLHLMRLSRPPTVPVTTSEHRARGCGGIAIPMRLYIPPGAVEPGPGLVFFHGGGLVAGDLDSHDALCRTLAAGSGCRLISVGYRLAPEHPFPAAIVDALLATRFVLRHAPSFGVMRQSLGIGGDSGGATLVAIVARLLGAHRLKAQILLCPLLDQATASPSRRAYGEGYMLDATTLAQDLRHYAPTRALTDSFVSPLRAAHLSGSPPAWIHVAGFDPLRDEGVAFAERLREQGVAAHLTCHDGLIHGFYALTAALAAASPALEHIVADIAAALT